MLIYLYQDIKPRTTKAILLQIPVDALRSLEEIAASRDMSIDALQNFILGKGCAKTMLSYLAIANLFTKKAIA